MKKQLLAALLLLTLLLPFASAEEKTEAEQTLPMLELHRRLFDPLRKHNRAD